MTTDRRADMTDTSDAAVATELRQWAKAYRDGPRELRFPSDPDCEFFPPVLERGAEVIATLSRQLAEAQAENASLKEQIGKLYKVCNERDVLKNELAEAQSREFTMRAAWKEAESDATTFREKLAEAQAVLGATQRMASKWRDDAFEARAVIERLTDAIEPFVNTARRMGWDKLSDPKDLQTLIRHVVEAPAEDIAPGAIYCLEVSAFTDLAAALNPTPPREEKHSAAMRTAK